ncbi:MAG: HIT domain-containing protein [Acidilobaceae archaeon]
MSIKCIFCDIVRGVEKAYTLYRSNGILVILDKYPVSKGHLLVLSEDHYESVHEAPPEVTAKVWLTASALARIFRVNLKAPGVNIITNSGATAGQEIYHFHVHVIPRWEPLRRFWSNRHTLTEEEAREVIDTIKDHTILIDEYLQALGL